MPELPRRKRFQIHLSTAIVLMFVAGGLIWANLTQVASSGTIYGALNHDKYGWPFTVIDYTSYTPNVYQAGTTPVAVYSTKRYFKSIVINTAVAFVILFAMWFTCEWRIRRRAARNGA